MHDTFRHGGDIYGYSQPVLDFSANLNPMGFPAGISQAILNSLEQGEHYPDPFCRQLIQALSHCEQIPPEWMICGNGAADLIYRLVWAVKPKKALLLAPCFSEYEQALQTVGAQSVHYSLDTEQNFSLTEQILTVLTPDLDCFFLCNPNNPTGLLVQPELLRAILKTSAKAGILVILDECFLDLTIQPEPYSGKPLLEQFPNLFLLKAFTKTYAMAGLRLGYGICSNSTLLQAVQNCGQPWSVSSVAQAAGICALQDSDYLPQSRRLIQIEREFLKEQLHTQNLLFWNSQANFLFFQAWPNLDQQLLRHGIAIRSCHNYRGLDHTYYRIAVRLPTENQRLIQVIKQIGGNHASNYP